MPPVHRSARPPTLSNLPRRRPTSGGRFLLVRLSALGDVLHALEALEALRARRPDARIDWIVEEGSAPLLVGHPAIDRIHAVPRARWRAARRRPWRWPSVAFEAARLVARLWSAHYDVALDVQGNLKSGFWSLFSGAPARFGLRTNEVREGNGFLTNRHVRPGGGSVHHADLALDVVAAAVGRAPADTRPARLPRSVAARAWTDGALSAHGLGGVDFAILHPGTSDFGAFKRWPAERFGRLARRLRDDGLHTVVTVGPGEAALGTEIARIAGEGAVVLSPPDLPALAELISRARVHVAADTGPLHLAAAHGVPVVALFGPKDAAIYGPRAARSRPAAVAVVTRDDVPCRPCELRRCPDPICMTSIDVDEVHARVRDVLGSAPPR